MSDLHELPILGVSGFSGSGKTTLLEQMVPVLRGRGATVVVVKHDCHGLDIDRKGKDSDRLFSAGADVLLQSEQETVTRSHGREADLEDTLTSLASKYDIVLVEGRKHTPFRKIWLLGENEAAPPQGIREVVAVIARVQNRLGPAMAIVDQMFPHLAAASHTDAS